MKFDVIAIHITKFSTLYDGSFHSFGPRSQKRKLKKNLSKSRQSFFNMEGPPIKVGQDDPSFNKLNKIMENILHLEKQVGAFQGEKNSKEYKCLDEMLTKSLLALDGIDSDGEEDVRQQRKESINSINNLVSILESKTKTFQAEKSSKDETSKSSPRGSPTTKFNQLGYVFSSKMTDFDKNVLPKEHEVISVWISKYDEARGQKRQLSKSEKNEVIEDIVQSLIFIWQSQNLPIIEASRIKAQWLKIRNSFHKI